MTGVDEWWTRAACIGKDPELFFPDRYEDTKEAAALAICAGCCVQEQCLAYALRVNETAGIWGGTTARGRRKILRKRRRAA